MTTEQLWEIVYAINRALPWDTEEMDKPDATRLFAARNLVTEILEERGELV